jgi:hypothetical protein
LVESAGSCGGAVDWSYSAVGAPGPRSDGSIPYWKTTVVAWPCGLTVPDTDADVALDVDGELGITAGGLVGGGGGDDETYVKRSAELVALLPPAFVTMTSTVPVPGGEVTTICVPVLLVTVAPADPNLTVALVKFVPLIVTDVPPPAGPEDGLIELMVGAGGLPPILYVDDTVGRSELVATVTVSVVEVVVGLVTLGSVIVSESPPLTVDPLKMKQVSVWPLAEQLPPTCGDPVWLVSTTLLPPLMWVRSVPAGNTIEIVLCDAPDIPPVADTANDITYVTPAALGA